MSQYLPVARRLGKNGSYHFAARVARLGRVAGVAGILAPAVLADTRQLPAQFGCGPAAPPEEVERRVVEPPVLPAAHENGAARGPNVGPPLESENGHCPQEGRGLTGVHVQTRPA